MGSRKAKKAAKPAKKQPKAKTPEQLKAEELAARAALKAQQMDTIANDVGLGIPLAEICRRAGMPCLRTVYNWQEEDAAFAARIARAREAGYDMIAAEALRIADTQVVGERRKQGKDGLEIVTEDMLGHRKLQVETRLKLLAKWDPKRYGDKVEHSGPDGGPIPIASTVTMDATEAYLRMKGGK